jgi:hypothetical protein
MAAPTKPLPEEVAYRTRRALQDMAKSQSDLLVARLVKVHPVPGDVLFITASDDALSRISYEVLGVLKQTLNKLAGGDVGVLLVPEGMELTVKDRDQAIEHIKGLPVKG